MLGAVGYQTKFVTVAVDRARPSEWSHVYLAALHPGTGRWVPLDPIVREFGVGEEVPAGQLTAPRAYHEGVDPMMRGGMGCVGCANCGMSGCRGGLGHRARGMGAVQSDYATALPEDGGPGSSFYANNFGGGAASSSPAPVASSGPAWYEKLFGAGVDVYGKMSAAQIAASQARSAEAQAKAAQALAHRGGAPAPGFFASMSPTTKVVVAVAAVGVGYAIFKALRRR